MIDKWEPEGTLKFKRGFVATPKFPLKVALGPLKGHFEKDVFRLDSMSAKAGASDLRARGELQGLLRALTHGGVLKADLALDSKHIDANEIMSAVKAGADAGEMEEPVESEETGLPHVNLESATDTTVLIVVPANVIADLSLNVGDVLYDTLTISGVRGHAAMRERCLQLTDFGATTDFAKLSLNAFYSTRTRKDISVGADMRLHNITADKVIALVPQVDTIVPLLKSFKGNLNVEIGATSQLDTAMNFLLHTVDGMFKISGNDLIVDELGDLKKITRLLMFKNKNVLAIDDMNVYGVVSDNVFELFPFLLELDRYSMAISGRQDFSDSFKYKVTVIKSPLPFRFGFKIYGKDYGSAKIRLMNPQYKSTKLPAFNDQVDDMQVNLLTMIRNIFGHGADRAMKDNHRRAVAIDEKKAAVSYNAEAEEDMSEEDAAALEKMADDAEAAETAPQTPGEGPESDDSASVSPGEAPSAPSEAPVSD